MRASSLAATLFLGAALSAAGWSVTAQVPSPASPQGLAPMSEDSAETVKDNELQVFAQAVGEIRQLRRKWMPQVDAAAQQGGPDAALKVQDQAYEEMVGAVEKKGLSLKRYNQIAALAQNDPDLQQRLAEHLPRDR